MLQVSYDDYQVSDSDVSTDEASDRDRRQSKKNNDRVPGSGNGVREIRKLC
jgi:hypothetical protein